MKKFSVAAKAKRLPKKTARSAKSNQSSRSARSVQSAQSIRSVLTKKELQILKRLNTPIKIQNFLDTMPINHEHKGETYMSPRRVLELHTAHCLEGALLAGLALCLQGQEALILDLKSHNGDDHTVALYKIHGHWGAISKTNHATLRFRDPIYKTVRELAASYFHEYIHLKTGEKILRSYSEPFNVIKRYGLSWITREDEMFDVAEDLDESRHFDFCPKKNLKYLRKADAMELKAGNIIEWTG